MISVIITVYEQAKTLGWLLRTLSVQDTVEPFEVLVCDDGSGNSVPSIINEVLCSIRLDVRHIWQPKYGYRNTRIRNAGIRCAQGDLLVFVDADMVLPKNFLSKHRAAHSNNRTIICGTRSWVKIPDEKNYEDIDSMLMEFVTINYHIDRQLQSRWFASSTPWLACFGCNFSVQKTSDVYFDENLLGWGTEDWELACRLKERHNFLVQYNESIEGYHVEFSSGNLIFNVMRRNKHEELIDNIRNKLYFRAKYPEVNMDIALDSMRRIRLNKDEKWCAVSPEDAYPDLATAISLAQAWLDCHGNGNIYKK